MRRRDVLARSLPWPAALVAAATLWSAYVPVPRRSRLDAFAPFTQLLAARPAIASALMLIAVAGIVRARRRPSAAAAFALLFVAAALAWAQIAPRTLSRPQAGPRAAPQITVLAANTLHSRVAPSAIVALVRRSRADVVALPETNAVRARAYARALTADRHERWLAHGDRLTSPTDPSPRPTSLLVRSALGPRWLANPASALRSDGQVRVRLTRFGGRSDPVAGPTIVAMHAVAPAPIASQTDWRRDLLALRSPCRAGWVVAGDFNATLDHSPMRALRRAGCRDAAATTGHGLTSTWSAFGVLRLVLDHVLTSGRWHATDSGVLAMAGSDHRALWARIAERPPG